MLERADSTTKPPIHTCDQYGNIVKETNSRGVVTTYTYNIHGELVETVQAASIDDSVWADVDEPDALEELAYSSTRSYDARRRMKESQRDVTSPKASTLQQATSYVYDYWGNAPGVVNTNFGHLSRHVLRLSHAADNS